MDGAEDSASFEWSHARVGSPSRGVTGCILGRLSQPVILSWTRNDIVSRVTLEENCSTQNADCPPGGGGGLALGPLLPSVPFPSQLRPWREGSEGNLAVPGGSPFSPSAAREAGLQAQHPAVHGGGAPSSAGNCEVSCHALQCCLPGTEGGPGPNCTSRGNRTPQTLKTTTSTMLCAHSDPSD